MLGEIFFDIVMALSYRFGFFHVGVLFLCFQFYFFRYNSARKVILCGYYVPLSQNAPLIALQVVKILL
jgi:hypothetical protein